MKKLMLLVAACCFVFASCNQPKGDADQNDSTVVAQDSACEKECCKGECCEMMKAWEDWDNQTDEMKADLIEKRVEKINECLAHIDEIKCPEGKAAMQEFQKEWEGFAALTDVEAQKALIDKFPCKCKKEEGNCCKKEGEGCCKKEGDCCNK